jgi:aerobic-type carbon monoxide dehydrogenase small subunit (CoxS/CutS family)
MAEEKEKELEKKGLSRREFLKDAGLVVGGAAVGSMALAAACSSTTTTVSGPTSTVTVTSPPVTTTVTNVVDPRSVFNVNGTVYKIDIQPYWSLNFVIREKLGLTFTKIGCDRGECGHCTVLVNGIPVYSCLMLAQDATNQTILTAESLSPTMITLSPMVQGFHDNEAFQCGFCTAGILMATKALFAANPKPTLAQVQTALSGHLCVCTSLIETCNTVVTLGQQGAIT